RMLSLIARAFSESDAISRRRIAGTHFAQNCGDESRIEPAAQQHTVSDIHVALLVDGVLEHIVEIARCWRCRRFVPGEIPVASRADARSVHHDPLTGTELANAPERTAGRRAIARPQKLCEIGFVHL